RGRLRSARPTTIGHACQTPHRVSHRRKHPTPVATHSSSAPTTRDGSNVSERSGRSRGYSQQRLAAAERPVDHVGEAAAIPLEPTVALPRLLVVVPGIALRRSPRRGGRRKILRLHPTRGGALWVGHLDPVLVA